MSLRCCALLALMWSSSVFAQAPVVADQTAPVLMIIGASYAADWGAPRIAGHTVRNVGVGGQETKDMLARFDRDVLAARPQTVLIWGFINNIHRAPNADYAAAQESVKSDYREMVEQARRAGVDVILATEITLTEAMSLTDRAAALVGWLLGKRGYSDRINEQVRAVNEWLREFARQNGLQLLDFEATLDDGNGFRRREFTRDDGSHVTEAAYRVLTAYTAEALSPP